MEHGAFDGCSYDQSSLAVGQVLEARREERTDLLRDTELREVVGNHPTVVLPREAFVVDEHREKLLGEERVPLRSIGDSLLDVGRNRATAEQVRDQAPTVVFVQWIERHGRRVPLAAAPPGVS